MELEDLILKILTEMGPLSPGILSYFVDKEEKHNYFAYEIDSIHNKERWDRLYTAIDSLVKKGKLGRYSDNRGRKSNEFYFPTLRTVPFTSRHMNKAYNGSKS